MAQRWQFYSNGGKRPLADAIYHYYYANIWLTEIAGAQILEETDEDGNSVKFIKLPINAESRILINNTGDRVTLPLMIRPASDEERAKDPTSPLTLVPRITYRDRETEEKSLVILKHKVGNIRRGGGRGKDYPQFDKDKQIDVPPIL